MSTCEFTAITPSSERARLDEPIDEGISYGGSRNLFRQIALSMGVELSPQEDYDWLAIMQMCMLIDHLGDESQTDIASSLFDIASGSLSSDLDMDAQVRTHNYIHRQSPERQKRLFDLATGMDALLQEQRVNTTIERYIDIRKAEAGILVELLSLTDSAKDHQSRIEFNEWLKSWAHVGYLLDSLIDMNSDYMNGESSVKPSISARFSLLRPLLKESLVALQRTPNRQIGKCALNAVNYLARNKRVQMTSVTETM